ncbi:DapH/DapD/GlmU-related protein [Lapidilactobacillus luobeiensis]|uniref:DapH/DapD/GlmU-related protein n=1 Tax=Lapidilactobacillus luobeiensis TaxID=2950371 RepID=UPI0028529360|nr:DapH/DapD/GlmU-related protein [Lapidilactobacillus luobeiensis]
MTIEKPILARALAGERLTFNDPGFAQINATMMQTEALLGDFDQAGTDAARREILSKIVGYSVPVSSDFHTGLRCDFGRHLFIGQRVFVNQGVTMIDLGGIYLADDVLIGPNATLITVNHIEDPKHRRDVRPQAIHLEKGAWIGANAMILPGVTIGAQAIVGAGSVVTKDVPAATIVVGTPARILRRIKEEEH